MSVNGADPSTLFGGTWERIKDTFLLASGDVYAENTSGGSTTVTLTTNEIPSHSHTSAAHSHGLNGHTHTISHTHTRGGM